MKAQFQRSEYQIKLYQVHHYQFDSCRCLFPHGKNFDCTWDCCKYDLSETAKREEVKNESGY